MANRLYRIWTNAWPLLAALFFLPFGSDLVTLYVAGSGIRGPLFFILPCLSATLDIIFWNWFFGWGSTRIANAHKVREVIEEFNVEHSPDETKFVKTKIADFWTWLVHFVENSISMKEGWKRKWSARLLNLIRRRSPLEAYTIIFLVPICPSIGIFIGIIACRMAKLPYAFLVLLTGNLIKVLIFTGLAYLAVK